MRGSDHFAREEGMFEVRGVADAGGEHDDGRIGTVGRRERPQRREERLAIMRDRPDVVFVEEAWKHPLGDGTVRQHVRDAAWHPQVVLEYDESSVFQPHEIRPRH